MIRAAACLVQMHDMRLVLLALALCVLASLTAFQLLGRALVSVGYARLAWLAPAAAAAGCGVWATHFLAMLAFRTSVPMAFSLPLMLASAAVATVFIAAGWCLACLFPARAALGGAAAGLGIVTMHAVGMASLRMPARIDYDMPTIALATVLGCALGAAALHVFKAGSRSRTTLAALVFSAAVCAAHFTSMSAATIVPGGRFELANTALPGTGLAIALIAAVGTIIVTALGGALIDRHVQSIRMRSRELLADAMESMTDGIAIFDRRGRLQLANSALLDHIWDGHVVFEPGRSFGEILSLWVQHVGLTVDAAEQDRFLARIRAAYEKATGEAIEASVDGRWYLLRYVKTRDQGRLFVEVDITALKQTEAELEAARDQATQASQAKSRFLAVMGHELRTPINAVMGFADLLLGDQLSEPQRNRVRMIRLAGENLLLNVNDVLDLTKVEAGKMSFESVPTAVADTIEAAISMIKPQLTEKQLTLSVELAEDVPASIQCDPIRLRQVLLNLLSNAVKFTATGGITVRARTLAAGPVPMLRFEVEDTGIGIAPAKHLILFQEFVQVDPSIARKFGGTGLGLAICRRMVEGMGGEIGLNSAPGTGSTFWFTIRAVVTTAVAEPEQNGLPTAAAGTVLVADDVVTNQILIQEILRRSGYVVRLVSNGREAIDAVRRGGIDVVLMDMYMPEIDGVTATRAIRALPGPVGRLPILAVTAYTTDEVLEACRASGINAVLHKPIDRDRLLHALAECRSASSDQEAVLVAA